MRVEATEYGTNLWMSASDTYAWADGKWPCSFLAGRRLFAAFDTRGDLVEMEIDDGRGDQDCPADEFNAITSDVLREKIGPEHPATRERGA